MIFTELTESARIAFEQIFASKMRSFLSALGVVIGISVVIIMGWLILALNDVVESTFDIMGVDVLWVARFDWSGGKTWEEMRNRKRITYNVAKDFKERMKSGELVTIQSDAWGNNSVKYKNNTYEGIGIEGDDFAYQYISNGEISEGRYFSQLEEDNGQQVAILGTKVVEAMFPNGGNPIGKQISIMGRHFTIVGIFKKRGTAMMDFIDNRIGMPLMTFIKLYGVNRDFSIGVKAGGATHIDNVRYETQGVMRAIRNLRPDQDDDFSINESKAFEESTKVIRASVYGVGIGMTMLSFIVGIIGVMNIMFVSVTERTKEIGIRKAIGAKSRSILFQFIIEAVALCFIGAIVSFVFCSALVYAAASILPTYIDSLSFLSPYLPLNLLLLATFISIGVGVIAGIIPAMRAANLVPVDALRWE